MTNEQQRLPEQIDKVHTEIHRLEGRRDELTDELKQARGALQTARSDVIDGAEGAGEEARRLQAQITSTESTLELLRERLEAKCSRREDLRRRLTREDTRKELEALAEKASKTKARYEDAYASLAGHLAELSAELAAAQSEWTDAAEGFEERAETLPDGVKVEARRIEEERASDLAAVRERAPSWRTLPKHKYSAPDAGKFGELIDQALRLAQRDAD